MPSRQRAKRPGRPARRTSRTSASLPDPLLRSARSAPVPQAPADARNRQGTGGKEDERGEQKPSDHQWVGRHSWHRGCCARVIQKNAVEGLDPVSPNDQDPSIG